MCPNVLTCGEYVCVYEYVDMICGHLYATIGLEDEVVIA